MPDPWGVHWEHAKERLGLYQYSFGGWQARRDPNEPLHDHGRWSVTTDEGEYLRETVRGRGVIEIGTGLGISTRFILESCRWLVTCDIDPWVQSTVWPDLVECGPVLFCSDASRLVHLPVAAQVTFIDGCHEHAWVMADLHLALGITLPDGLILLHDVNYQPIVRAVADLGLDMQIRKSHNCIGVIQVGGIGATQ